MPVSFFPVMFLARRSRQPPPLYGLRGAAGWRAHARLARRAHPLLATLPETGGRATPAHLPWWGVPWWGPRCCRRFRFDDDAAAAAAWFAAADAGAPLFVCG